MPYSISIEIHTRRHHPFRYLYRSPKANPIKAAVYANLSKVRKQDPELSRMKSYDVSAIAGEVNRALLRTIRDILIKSDLYPVDSEGKVDEMKVRFIRDRYRMRFDIKARIEFDLVDDKLKIISFRVEEFHYQIRLEISNVSLPPEALEQIVRREIDVTELTKIAEEEEEEEGE